MGSEGYVVWMDGPISKEHHSLSRIADCTKMPFYISKANAALIVAAVNACFAINPENPLAAVEGMAGLVEACKNLTIQLDTSCVGYDIPAFQPFLNALAKLEAKP